jgi:hypothetical protein
MAYYKCRKCGYEKNLFRDMKNHININKSCIKDFSCMDLSNDEIFIMTLIPYCKGIQNIDFEKIKKYNNTYKNKNVLLEILFNIDKNKIKNCIYCNKNFSKIKDLKHHIIMDCFENEMSKKNINIQNLSITEQNLSLNINSGNTINNINIILNLNNAKPVPFDDNWNISSLNNKDKSNIMISKYMYSLLLTEILDNNNNLNVIIDKEKDFGIVYKNDFEKYIKMEIKQIISNSMEKLEKNLLNISKDLQKNGGYDDNYLINKDNDIRQKYSAFKYDLKTAENVNKCMTDIFDKKKDMSKKIMKDFLLQNELSIQNNENNKEINTSIDYLKY